MKFLNILLILIIFAYFSNAKIKVDPETLQLVDEFGRKRLYHGVNVVYKVFPFYPDTETFSPEFSLTNEDLQNLSDWGVNFIRLYASWQGLEAVKGEYNQTLLNKILEITQMAEQYNISVLIDAHQDVYNRKFCGEGAPDWAVRSATTFPLPIGFSKLSADSQGYPELDQCLKKSFAEYYFSYDAGQAFQDLYDNVNGVQDHFGQMWYILADTFKNQENVIGYEIINEPFNGNIYKDPLLMYNADKKNLQPFYKNINKRIREADNDTIVFFEPIVFDIVAITLDDTPGGIDYRDREVFSYHVYCGITTDSTITNWACDKIDEIFINQKTKKAKELGVGAFLTEFGAISDTPDNLKQIDFVTSEAEKRFQGWSYWQFKAYGDYTTTGGTAESFYTDSGDLQISKVKSISRPYFYAICGDPISTSFDTESGQFEFEFIYNKCSNGKNSELYLSEDFYYATGFKSAFQGCEDCVLGKINDKYYYELIVPDSYQGQNIKISIQA